MTNFCVDCLQNVLLQVLSHCAEESGVALLNDLEVAVYHTEQLETVLADATAKGFPPAEHTT
jgi:hypothetical protein